MVVMGLKKVWICMIGLFCSFVLSSCMNHKLDAISEKKDLIISVNKKVGSLTFLNQINLKKITDWNLNRDVSGAALLNNGKVIAVFHPEDPTIDLYQLSSGEKMNSWQSEKGITNMLSLNSKNMVAVSNGEENTITFFSQKGKVVKKLKVGNNPTSMIEDPVHNKLFVSLFNEKRVVGINLDSLKIDQTIEVPLTSNGLYLNEESSELYIGGHGNGEVENEDVRIFSTVSGEFIKALHTPLMPISFFQNNDGVFTIAHGTNQIYKLNPNLTNQKEFLEVGSNPYSAIGYQHTAYVASYDLNKLYEINTSTMKITKEAAVGRGPFQLLLREGNHQ